jgi:hypothetical protein
VAHVYHLQAESYAQHVALGEFYEALPGLVDSYAETYQGCYGLIDGYPSSFEMPSTAPKEWAVALAEEVEEGRGSLPDDSPLQNIVDEILACINKLVYKLNFLE